MYGVELYGSKLQDTKLIQLVCLEYSILFTSLICNGE